MNHYGWMHNRGRMIVAMYLTKDLMLDWRLGEKVNPLRLHPEKTDLIMSSTSWKTSSTVTSPRITVAGNGVPVQVQILSHISASSTQSRKVKRYNDFELMPTVLILHIPYDLQADPSGEYIKHYVPELAKLKGKGTVFSNPKRSSLISDRSPPRSTCRGCFPARIPETSCRS